MIDKGGLIMEKKKTAVEVYQSVVFKWGIITLVCACMCAAILYTMLKIMGLFPAVSWSALIVFDIMDVAFLVGGFWLVNTSFEGGYLKEGRLRIGKMFAFLVLLIQWNYILYMVPSKTFWGFLFFFVILMGFFLDIKLAVGFCCLSILSLLISWFVCGNNMPARNSMFITDIINCITALLLSTVGMGMFLFFMTNFLVNAKKDELEENNHRVQGILDKVTTMAERLGDASDKLLSSSQSESESTEKLSAITQNLLQSSGDMLEKSVESRQNLSDLASSNKEMVGKMAEVNELSTNLLDISESNEKALGELTVISEDVEQSTKDTLAVTAQLDQEMGQIGRTLEIINDIAASTNLLALNASIEAARAGEQGRGFAVVASQIQSLAEQSNASAQQISEYIRSLMKDSENAVATMEQVKSTMQKQSEMVEKTDQVFVNVITGIKASREDVEKIADNTKELDASRNNVIDIVQSLSAVSQEYAASTEETSASASQVSNTVQDIAEKLGELQEIAVELKESVNKFKIAE